MDIGNMHKNLVKVARMVPKTSSRTDRQTDPQTDITILCNHSRGRSNNDTIRETIFPCTQKMTG